MKIIFCIDLLGKGGAEKNTFLNAQYFKSRGYSVEIVALYEGGWWEDRYREIDIPVHILYAKSNSIKDRRSWITIFKLFLHFFIKKPEVVVGVLYHSSIYAAIAARMAGITKIISNRRDGGFLREKAPFNKYIEWIADKCIVRYIAISNSIKDYLVLTEKIDSKKIITIYNGISIPNKIHSPNKDKIIVGMVANFNPRKNHLMLVNAAANVLSRVSNVDFVLLGKSSLYEDEVRSMIKIKKIEDHFYIEHIENDIENIIQLFDIGVLCSTVEGLGTAILEYMSHSIPTIGTNIDGIKELIVDNETGYLVDSNDAESLGNRIINLIQNPQIAYKFGVNGRKRAMEYFSLDKSFNAWETVILNLNK